MTLYSVNLKFVFPFRYLYNNHIKLIPKGAFHNLPRLRRLRLDHNALVCDCKLAWLSKMLTKSNVVQASANCAQPTEMHGMSLIGLEHKHFHCGKFYRLFLIPVFYFL